MLYISWLYFWHADCSYKGGCKYLHLELKTL